MSGPTTYWVIKKIGASFPMAAIEAIKLNILFVEQVRPYITKFTLVFSQGQEEKPGFH